MCSDENGAPHAVRYLNAQLAALHENAQKCLEEHDQAQSEENSMLPFTFGFIVTASAEHDRTEHFYALAEFTVHKPGSIDTAFYATFGKPALEFLCDHDVIIHFTLKTSRLILDSLRPGRSGCGLSFPSHPSVAHRSRHAFTAKTLSCPLILWFLIDSPLRLVASSATT